MNRDVFEGKWMQFRGTVKETWGRLTDDDLDKVEGRFDRLVGFLQERYGYARETAERKIENVLSAKQRRATGLAFLLAMLLPAVAAVTACGPTKDVALSAEVKTKLAADSAVQASAIDVRTERGVVTLKGNLDSGASKERALQIARETSGVVDVVDMIAVRSSSETGDAPSPSRTLGERVDDATITAAVKSRLLEDPEVKGLRIDVDTREGVVFLTGTVGSESEKERAVLVARETKHVKDVQANLEVARG